MLIDSLANLRFARYEVEMEARERLLLPPYKGSTLRGGFGTTFRRMVCSRPMCTRPMHTGTGEPPSQVAAQGRSRGDALHGATRFIGKNEVVGKNETAVMQRQSRPDTLPDCKDCILKDTCPYSIIFESSPPEGSEALRNYEHIPRPFVLEPPLTPKTEFEPGEKLTFGLVLTGRGIDYLPYFIVTLRELGRNGLGKGRGRFELRRVWGLQTFDVPFCGGNAVEDYRRVLVYDGDSGRVWNCDVRNVCGSVRNIQEGIRTLTIKFETMTRLKYGGALVDIPEFHILMRGLTRRVSSLLYFHHGGERLAMDFAGFFSRAEKVRLAVNKTRWVDWERFSSRQGTRMKLGGIVGEARFEGDLGEFLPWLAIGQYIHVGKGATFGLGKYRIMNMA